MPTQCPPSPTSEADKAASRALLERADRASVRMAHSIQSLMDAISSTRTLEEVAGVEEVLKVGRPSRTPKRRSTD